MLKRILNWVMFILTGKGEIANEAVDEGLIDYSGQGRDKYGKTTTELRTVGHRFDDLSGSHSGIYKVLEFDHMRWYGVDQKHGMSYYKCECQKCGRIFVRARSELTQKKTTFHRGECK